MYNKITLITLIALAILVNPQTTLAASPTNDPNLFVLHQESFESHSMCRARLDSLVGDTSRKLLIGAIKVTDQQKSEKSNGEYLYRIHPQLNETMSLLCDNKQLKIWYEFNK